MSLRDSVTRWLRLEEAVGVDLGSHTIKLALVENVGGLLRLTRTVSGPMPRGAVEGGVVTRPEQVAGAVRSMLSSIGQVPHQAIAAVSGPSVVVRVLRMPPMREVQLERAVRVQAEELVPFPLTDAIVEHCVLRRDLNSDPPGLDVAVVVVPSNVTVGRLTALELAQLDPIAIDIEPFARIAATIDVSTQPLLRSETVGLLDLGAATSELTITQRGSLATTRSLTFGGEALTRAIAAATQTSEEEAERRKARDVVAVGLDQVDPPPCEAPEASMALAPLVDSLIRQIGQTLNSFRSQTPGADRGEAPPIDRLLLTGGTALLPGLAALLEERIGARTEIANVFQETAIDCPTHGLSPAEGALFTVALGLTLREHVRHGRHEWLVAA